MAGGTRQTFPVEHFMENNSFHFNEVFWTIQGEGRWTGRRALFLRLPYCNYECPWCDTEFNSFKQWSKEEVLEFCNQEPSRFAVITGGEPLAHKHLPRLVELLKSQGFYIACETNGSLPAPEGIDFISCSPKSYTKGKLPPYFVHPDLKNRVSEWKYVVDDLFDMELLKKHKDPKKGVRYSLSPEYNKMDKNLLKIIEYMKENPQWQLSLQTHKWIGIS